MGLEPSEGEGEAATPPPFSEPSEGGPLDEEQRLVSLRTKAHRTVRGAGEHALAQPHRSAGNSEAPGSGPQSQESASCQIPCVCSSYY